MLLREDASGFGARQLLGRVTPTVGREKEIALLLGIYGEMAEDGTPRAALVTGPAGIGKSRVRAELMAAPGDGALRARDPALPRRRDEPRVEPLGAGPRASARSWACTTASSRTSR